MRSMLVVEVDVATDEVLSFGPAFVRPQIDLLVLDRSPEALDEDIVAPGVLLHCVTKGASVGRRSNCASREMREDPSNSADRS